MSDEKKPAKPAPKARPQADVSEETIEMERTSEEEVKVKSGGGLEPVLPPNPPSVPYMPYNPAAMVEAGAAHSLASLFEGMVQSQLYATNILQATTARCVNHILDGGARERAAALESLIRETE